MYELVNENNVFIDCVRRMRISTQAKIFVVDDLSYEVSLADDAYCGIDPRSNGTSTADDAAEGDETTSGATWSHLQQTPMWATAVACMCSAGLLRQRTAGQGARTKREFGSVYRR